jgi:hypothetical protein
MKKGKKVIRAYYGNANPKAPGALALVLSVENLPSGNATFD